MQSAFVLDCGRFRRGPVIPMRLMKRKPKPGCLGCSAVLKTIAPA